MIANPEVADIFRKRAKVDPHFFLNVVLCFLRTTFDVVISQTSTAHCLCTFDSC